MAVARGVGWGREGPKDLDGGSSLPLSSLILISPGELYREGWASPERRGAC